MGLPMRGFAACGALLTIACMSTDAAPGRSCIANDNAVIEAVLRNEISRDTRLKPAQILVVYDSTVQPRRKVAGDIARFVTGPAARALNERNSKATTLADAPVVDRIRFVREKELRVLFPTKVNDPQEAWRQFYDRFPTAAGLVNVSLPGYDADRCEALLYVERQGGVLAAEGFIVRLAWRNGRWSVVKREIQWIS